MQLFSLFFAEEFNHDEGWGAAVYHGTFSTAQKARNVANGMMVQEVHNTVTELLPDHEAVTEYLNTTETPAPEHEWTEYKWGEADPQGEWQIVRVDLDVPNSGAHLL